MTATIKRGRVTSLEDFEKKFEQKTSKSSGNTLWPTRVGYKGRNELRVRFLTEPDQWIFYEQYWDPAIGRPVVATEENQDAYAARNLNSSIIHLAAAVDVETNQVIVIELKWSLVKKINAVREKYTERFGPITSYDIELSKKGEGKEGTEYFAMWDGDSDIDLSRYTIPNGHKSWQDYLWTVVEKLVGDNEDSDDAIEDDSDEEDESVAEETTAPVAKKRVVRKKANA